MVPYISYIYIYIKNQPNSWSPLVNPWCYRGALLALLGVDPGVAEAEAVARPLGGPLKALEGLGGWPCGFRAATLLGCPVGS